MTSYWRMAKTGAWIVGADDGTQCSASADTVVIQSDDDDQDVMVLRSDRTLSDVARNAAMKKPAPMCEACDAPIGVNDTCLSGNTKLCELCDLSEWTAHMCSECISRPALWQTEYTPLCSENLCDVCDLIQWVQRHGIW